jgi:hypothetical protein
MKGARFQPKRAPFPFPTKLLTLFERACENVLGAPF